MPQDNHVALVCALSKWIENHTGRVIHLEELAAYSGYSLWHMQKIFKEVAGISLGKYIRQRRLAGAVNALRQSEQTIFDIALDFGFGSQSHFTYMFRKDITSPPTTTARILISPWISKSRGISVMTVTKAT